MNILKECLIVNVCVSTWMGHKLDKETTRKVTEGAGAKSDAARVTKHIIPGEALKGITTAIGRVRVRVMVMASPGTGSP